MGTVVSAKLGEYVCYVAFDSVLSNRKLTGDHFVCVAARDQAEHIDLAWGQLVVRGVVSQFGGDLRGYSLFAGIDSTDGLQEFFMHVPLQYISPRTSFESAQHLDVACVRRQDNDSGIGKFAAYADDSIDAIQAWHLEIH